MYASARTAENEGVGGKVMPVHGHIIEQIKEIIMPVVDVHAAQVQLSSLLARVEAGEEIVIARHGKSVAKLVRCRHFGKRQFGALKGRISIDDRFFDPLPGAELAVWGQGDVASPA